MPTPVRHPFASVARRPRVLRFARPCLHPPPWRQAGGQLDRATVHPRRPRVGVHAGGGEGLRGDRGGRAPRPRVHVGPAHRGRRHRRLGGARPGQHRAACGAAGDGGQGRAVQAVRQHRRGADLPGHPGHRGDHRDGPGHRALVRWDQPGGHRRPALLRDRTAPRRHVGHPGLPRRPAWYGHRRARRAAQRGSGW
jgi:hypothetical protein